MKRLSGWLCEGGAGLSPRQDIGRDCRQTHGGAGRGEDYQPSSILTISTPLRSTTRRTASRHFQSATDRFSPWHVLGERPCAISLPWSMWRAAQSVSASSMYGCVEHAGAPLASARPDRGGAPACGPSTEVHREAAPSGDGRCRRIESALHAPEKRFTASFSAILQAGQLEHLLMRRFSGAPRSPLIPPRVQGFRRRSSSYKGVLGPRRWSRGAAVAARRAHDAHLAAWSKDPNAVGWSGFSTLRPQQSKISPG